MTSLSTIQYQDIRQLAAARTPGHGLVSRFYGDPIVHQADLETIWFHGWLFVGHSCQLKTPGDYLTLQVDTEPVVVIRGDDGQLGAFSNICRHRGTILCNDTAGHAGRLVCPYHQWTYDRGGQLVSCRGMDDDLDTSTLGLHRFAGEETGGLVFVSLAATPPPFDVAAQHIGPAATPQGLERARVAATVDYRVRANWKIVWENNRECFHCNANHPQYILANFDHYNTDDTSPQIQAAIDAATQRSQHKWAASGLEVTHTRTGMATFPAPGPDGWIAVNRTPLVDGYLSETMNGQQVAPLMGDYVDPDVGTLRMRTMPNFWNHSSCDHSVSTRLLPDGPHHTRIQVTWLVDESAEANRDYQLEDIMPFWQLTSEQDWAICESVHRGVTSRYYSPGPLSEAKEYNVDALLNWYLDQLNTAGMSPS